MKWRNIFNAEFDVIFSAAVMIGFFSFLSKALGILRNRIFAGEFGAGDTMDVYFAAFLIPDFLYSLLILGILSSVFIPVFAEYEARNKEEAWRLANVVLTVFCTVFAVCAAIAAVFAPWLVALVAPGFDGEKQAQTALLMRIMFLSPILLGASNIIGNMLQARRRFFAFALAPVMYNIGIIIGALFLVKPFGVAGLAVGVVLGALLHFLIQIPAVAQLGFSFRPEFTLRHLGLVKIARLSLPRTVGLVANQLNFVVVTAIASTVASGSIAVFYFANDLQFVPISIIALSFVSAVFPFLAASYAKGDIDAFLNKLYDAINQILYFVIPISLFLILMRAQLVRVLLGYGQFSWEDTRLTAAAVGAFALSIFAQSLVPLFSRAFYALQDTKTPVVINIASTALAALLSFYFLHLMTAGGEFARVVGAIFRVSDLAHAAILALPLAFSVASVINLLALYSAFMVRVEHFDSARIVPSLFKINVAAACMAVAVYGALHIAAQWVNMQTFAGVFAQGGFALVAGAIVYGAASHILRIPEFASVVQSFSLPVKRIFLSRLFPVSGSEEKQ
ncbi:murein biosynthesis integral membrane protein MurJ [Candidatus Azambacteria bacterium]|nr:murein biosynthesis integral membrane protein MurJ [Candidatus Azambacteria bacterium]